MGLKTLASNRNNRYSAGQIKLPKIMNTFKSQTHRQWRSSYRHCPSRK